MDLGLFLAKEKKITDTALDKLFCNELRNAATIDDSFLAMVLEIKTLALRGGKRSRSILTRLAYKLAGGGKKEIIEASLFVELSHLFILVHDDIADRDFKRYGGPTLEVSFQRAFFDKFACDNHHFGTSLAIIGGDYLFTLANEVLHQTSFGLEQINEAERLMAKTLKEVMAGWLIHQWQNYEDLSKASSEQYLKGMRLVSGSYSFEAPLQIGLALAGKTKQYGEALKDYADNVGVAFQIQDDILGVFGDSEKTGKPVGNDIREGKKTLLVLKAYELANDTGKELLSQSVGKEIGEQQLGMVQDLIKKSGSLDFSKTLAQNHIEKAKQSVRKIETQEVECVTLLEELADFVLARSF